jgi:hypothetical protein
MRFSRRVHAMGIGVLVLGAERRGVPARLLALLHATAETPKLGVARILNVHVARWRCWSARGRGCCGRAGEAGAF